MSDPEDIIRSLPTRVVVDSHGHYWRDYTDNPDVRAYSMCPVSDENNETDVIAIYYLVRPEDWVVATDHARRRVIADATPDRADP